MKKDYINKISLILITYKSDKIIKKFVKKIPKNLKTIIVENSNNFDLKEKLEKKYNDIKVYLKINNGVSSSLNFAVKKIKTDYFLQISPDINFNFEKLNDFYNVAKEKKDNFCALGPRFINVNKKSHKQINTNINVGSIKSIHGSVMFINKKKFNYIGGFDENFFLYFEETDYCKRGSNKNLGCYQINSIRVKQEGRTVNTNNIKENKKLSNILIWHFIWSKFYYNRKHNGFLISILFFIPLLIRIIFKITLNKILQNKKNLEKYNYRFNGLIASIKNEKSKLRP